MDHVSPKTTLGVILGASEWPQANLTGGPAFSNSARALAAYLLDEKGFHLPSRQLLNLFDSEETPTDMLMRLGKFIDNQTKSGKFRDVLIYYVGHGLFHGSDNRYYLAIRKTETEYEDITSLRMADLARRLKKSARFLRRFLILDSCFAGAATRSFQSEKVQVAVRKTARAFPSRGTLIYCSSSKEDPSLAPPDHPYTMFSGALIRSLREGSADFQPRLSMNDLDGLVWKTIREKFDEDYAVRPELHCPEKREGDLSELQLFPNPGRPEEPEWRAKRVLQYGNLSISSSQGGTLFLDGKRVDNLEQFEIYLLENLKAGTHHIKIRAPGFRDVEEKVLLRPDETLAMDYDPDPIADSSEARTQAGETQPPRQRMPAAPAGSAITESRAVSNKPIRPWLVWLLTATLAVVAGFLVYQFLPRGAGEKLPNTSSTNLEDTSRTMGDSETENLLDTEVPPGENLPQKNPELVSTGVEGDGFKLGQVKVFREGGLEIEMVWCPPGAFLMGSPESEKERDDDENQHEVTLTRGFWLARTELTQLQWKALMDGSNPSSFKGDSLPVESVSWEEVNRFIDKLNQRAGGSKYRLPTEAEWEYACRAGTTTPFHTGENLTTDQANYDGNYPYAGFPKGEYREKTMAVGSFEPNAWRLYDMHGNVWEWCSDWYGPYSGKKETDPAGPPKGSYRVRRGGSWHFIARYCRSANRNNWRPDNRHFHVGFRLLRTPE